MIIGALLHYTVEDTETTLDEIKEIFGDMVELFVSDMTKVSSKYKNEWGRERYYNEGFFDRLKNDGKTVPRVWKIKLSDKHENMKDFHLWAPAERLVDYKWEVEQFISFANDFKVVTLLIGDVTRHVAEYD